MLVRRASIALVFAWIVSLGVTARGVAQESLKWTSADGKEVTGEFVRMESKTVVLKLRTGNETKVPLSKLSLESHLQALKLARPEAFSKELIQAPEKLQAAKLPDSVPLASILESPFGSEPTIDSFLNTAVNQWKSGNSFIVWHMLPPDVQQKLIAIYSDAMKSMGPAGQGRLRSFIAAMTTLAETKYEWILQSPLAPMFRSEEDPEKAKEEMAQSISISKMLLESSRWDAGNFERNGIVNWLATNSEFVTFARQQNPTWNDISFNIVEQSADQAQVEFKVGDQEPKKLTFQKSGDLWILPEVVDALKQRLEQETTQQTYQKTVAATVSGLSMITSQLDKLNQSKTVEEFNQTTAQTPLLMAFANSASQQPRGSDGQNTTQGMPGFPIIPGLHVLISGPDETLKQLFGPAPQ